MGITTQKKKKGQKMKKIFNNSKRGISAILTLCILLGIAGTCLNVTAMAEENTEETAVATEEITTVVVEESTIFTEKPIVATEETTPELMPMMARGCNSVPQSAYSMYSYITNGYDPSIYTYHEYANTSAPYLPRTTTYVTYYMAGLARLVIGADGSAYYTPNHYGSWIKMY